MTEQPEAKPLLRVINADATPEEIAAIVAVFSTLGSAAPTPRTPRSLWATPRPRHAPSHGPGAWRASSLPH